MVHGTTRIALTIAAAVLLTAPAMAQLDGEVDIVVDELLTDIPPSGDIEFPGRSDGSDFYPRQRRVQRFPRRTSGLTDDGTRLGMGVNYDFFDDDFNNESGGGISLQLFDKVTTRDYYSAALDLTFLDQTTNYNLTFGGGILNRRYSSDLCDSFTTNVAFDYSSLQSVGIDDWGVRNVTGLRLCPDVEIGGMFGWGFEGGSTLGGLTDYGAAYAQLDVSRTVRILPYVGGTFDGNDTLWGVDSAVLFGRNQSVSLNFGGSDNSEFGARVSYDFLFGRGAPIDDNLGGGAHRLRRLGAFNALPFWKQQMRRW